VWTGGIDELGNYIRQHRLNSIVVTIMKTQRA